MNFSYFNRLLFSIGLLSVSMIAFQLSLMQYLSIVQWYHFAYMIIAIALLGFGAAGTFIALFRNALIQRIKVLLPLCITLTGIFMPLSLWLSGQPLFRFDTYLLFVEQKEIWRLLLFELIFFLPFFFCALAIGMVFIKYANRIGKLYFGNLLGSGLGGILIILLFWVASPSQIAFITGLLSLLASFIIISSQSRTLMVAINIVIALVLLFFAIKNPIYINISQYKSLSQSLDLPETTIKTSKNSPYGLIQYITSPVLRYAPGLSLSYTGEVPVIDALFSNAEWAGPVLASQEDSEILDYTTSAVALEIIEPQKVLVLGAGTGIRTHYFSLRKIPQIDHVEPNPLLSKLSSKTTNFGSNVNLYQKDARSFLCETKELYDIISIPDIGSFGGNAGLNAIQEEYLLTTESFSKIYDHLDENGIMTITVWMDYPYRNALKVTATIAETLGEKGVEDPENYLIAIRSWNTITYLMKRKAFSKREIVKLRKFCDRLSFDPLLLPGITTDERNTSNILEDENLFKLTDRLISNERSEVYETYDFNIRPSRDDRPYFSQFLKWKNFGHLQKLFGDQSASFFELGYLIVAVTFLQSFLLAILLIVLPLFFLKRKMNNKFWTLFYFGGIGLGFMFIEIVLIQRFILFLGNPVYSVAAVISFMLFLSGIGSWYSSKLKISLISIRNIALVIAAILLFYAIVLPLILKAGMGLDIRIKILYTLVLIGIPAFFMGMPFPLGLRYLSERSEQEVSWAWGINGCFSVLSTSLATILAIEAGFTVLTLLGAAAYLLTMASCFIQSRS